MAWQQQGQQGNKQRHAPAAASTAGRQDKGLDGLNSWRGAGMGAATPKGPKQTHNLPLQTHGAITPNNHHTDNTRPPKLSGEPAPAPRTLHGDCCCHHHRVCQRMVQHLPTTHARACQRGARTPTLVARCRSACQQQSQQQLSSGPCHKHSPYARVSRHTDKHMQPEKTAAAAQCTAK
jgi:hypothetical protein